jgi:hypothetical protein
MPSSLAAVCECASVFTADCVVSCVRACVQAFTFVAQDVLRRDALPVPKSRRRSPPSVDVRTAPEADTKCHCVIS